MVSLFFFFFCAVFRLCSLNSALTKLLVDLFAIFCSEEVLGYIAVHEWKEKWG